MAEKKNERHEFEYTLIEATQHASLRIIKIGPKDSLDEVLLDRVIDDRIPLELIHIWVGDAEPGDVLRLDASTLLFCNGKSPSRTKLAAPARPALEIQDDVGDPDEEKEDPLEDDDGEDAEAPPKVMYVIATYPPKMSRGGPTRLYWDGYQWTSDPDNVP